MSAVELLEPSQVNPAPLSVASVDADISVVPADILDGDEIIQLSIKPSLWFVPLVSANMVVPLLMIAAAAAAVGSSFEWNSLVILVIKMAIIGTVIRIAFASLQWASRLYLLTNRRVMTFRGVLNVQVTQSPLNRIAEAQLESAWYAGLLGLGAVRMLPRREGDESLSWTYLARPADVHELLNRAIRNSRRGS